MLTSHSEIGKTISTLFRPVVITVSIPPARSYLTAKLVNAQVVGEEFWQSMVESMTKPISELEFAMTQGESMPSVP